ncbi:MAG: tellurite-like stress resistance cysteine protease StiP [Nostoc sp. DedQUE05]|uniref:cysteine protease StiP domain-containing protein n=1 Tax=Nostoc sp. DedQUE05 TaxID=3075391 RepID=UPI002AD4940A|nr:cysteine protease StiP domain-containing protein [Nostoc sp. DedQUE05]MDZ8095126.1 tellurite-like stress resistance cysteine protease StiP [Nostoc sp. DedQUE05]
MNLSTSLVRTNLWNQPVYAQFLQEIDPFADKEYFRSLNMAYDGKNTFWSLPSPEPNLDNEFWQLVISELADERIQQAASRLAASIATWEADPSKLVFVAILRAGVPIADWLCRLLPGSVAVSLSLFSGIGIDKVALQQVRSQYPQRKIIFVDGWTGRGGVARELSKQELQPFAVLVDPWGWADFSGTQDDLLCPTACFTGVATFGFSRTFYVNEANLFAAYLFPQQYYRDQLVKTWQKHCPGIISKPNTHPQRFFKSTAMRIHSNEVCRALINANPEVIYFADDLNHVKANYQLLLALAEIKQVKVNYNCQDLSDYKTRVACFLRNSANG